MAEMDRRTFMAICSAVGGGLVSNTGHANRSPLSQNDYIPPEIFPKTQLVKSLTTAPLKDDITWDERTFFTCFQGLVNRKEPRIYFIRDEDDRHWLEFYKTRYGTGYEIIDDPYALTEMFAEELKGYVVYDTNMLDSANVATVLGSLEDAVPVSEELVARLQAAGLSEVDNLVGRWTNRYDAYRWALAELFPRCNPRLLAGACVDVPHWPSHSIWLRDYLIAHKIFTFDLSASLRDREDFKLLNQICEKAVSPGCVMGWRCMRNLEQEYVAVAAHHGLFVLCCLGTLNLSVHSAIAKPKRSFVQSHKKPTDIGEVQKKVYISFMNTDGDALWSMLRCQGGRFKDEEHGSFPYTWGFLPMAYDLMPGVAQYNYESLTENDYFAAPASGVAYTYPHLHPRPRDFLRLTRYYMEKTGLRTVYVTNWYRDHWWNEVDVPGFVTALREELPDCLGYVRGMSESAFEKHYIGGGPPYVFFGEGIHRNSDVYTTITDFANANPIRPLFIYCLVNHTVTLARMKEAIDRFPKEEYELVRLDELLLLIDKAFGKGLIPGDDLYPEKAGLKKLMTKEAHEQWPETRDAILAHSARSKLTAEEFRVQVKEPRLDPVLNRSATSLADTIAFDVVWDSMKLVRLALNLKGIYVNNKGKAVGDFADVFGDVDEAAVVPEIWEVWERWLEQPVSYEQACDMAHRLGLLTRALDKELEIT